AIQALKDIATQEAITAVKTLIKEKGKAIAKVITSVMALPFPANILAVGGAIAAVTLLFSKIKLFGKGGIAGLHGPELIVAGEKGPELITPLSKVGAGIGGAIAAVTMLFKKIKLFGEGEIVPKKTLAMLHPREYVLPAPAVQALAQPGAGIGGGLSPVAVKINVYNYGDINNVGNLDEISKRLGEKTRRAIERGRK
ncbi:unnamed protein product, partial [marine sediment metagenome]